VSALAPLRDVLRIVESAGVPYMLVGSMASTFHGPPRSTQDIDVVIDPDAESLARFVRGFDRDRYYVPTEAAGAALASRGQFNVVDLHTGWKIDFMVRRDRPFSREEFERRRAVVVDGMDLHVSSVEDTILAKLEWAKLGGSDRQVADAASVLSVAAATVDVAYLDRWAEELGVVALLERARREAGS
jgi:hypothetical protein